MDHTMPGKNIREGPIHFTLAIAPIGGSHPWGGIVQQMNHHGRRIAIFRKALLLLFNTSFMIAGKNVFWR